MAGPLLLSSILRRSYKHEFDGSLQHTTEIWATSECTQIVSKSVGWAESEQTKLLTSYQTKLPCKNLMRVAQILVVDEALLF